MQIVDVEAFHLRVPTVHEIADGTQDILLVHVVTDEGIDGWGEVVSSAPVARAVIEAPRSASRRHGLAAILRGSDPLDPPARWLEMYDGTRWYGRGGVVMHAMSGVDQALWDVTAKAAGKSLSELWGRRHDRIRVYASVLFPDTAELTRTLAQDLRQQGFTAMKFGYGPFGTDDALDGDLVAALVEGAGAGIEVMIDAGRPWSMPAAVRQAGDLLAKFNLGWIEEPLGEDDLTGYAELCAQAPGVIAAGEADADLAAFERLLTAGVKVVQPDVGRVGGLTVLREIGLAADRHGARAVTHSFGTGVQLAASLQWAATRADPLLEFPLTASPLLRELASLPELRDGYVEVPDLAGIGAVVDTDLVATYGVA